MTSIKLLARNDVGSRMLAWLKAKWTRSPHAVPHDILSHVCNVAARNLYGTVVVVAECDSSSTIARSTNALTSLHRAPSFNGTKMGNAIINRSGPDLGPVVACPLNRLYNVSALFQVIAY